MWLSQNDQVKHLLDLIGIAATDPKQFGSDMTQVIETLQRSGAKVVISNLMDDLHAAAFVPQPRIATVASR